MRVIHWPDNNEELPTGCVATIGVFDGVHCGHRILLYELIAEAEGKETESLVLTFDRPPGEALGNSSPPQITSLRHRLKLFSRLGVDVTIVIEFTPDIASLTAREFAGKMLKDTLNVRKLIMGFDGRFGKDGRGGIELCKDMNIAVRRIPPVKIEGEVVSSTAIRAAIKAGDLMRTAMLLGRPYSIIGEVVHGDSYGTDIGFPTANLDTNNELLPREGVYAGRAYIDNSFFDAAVSVGRRTTVHGAESKKIVVEIYLINEHIDLYGQHMEVQFLDFLRNQVNFASIKDLRTQIEKDVDRAKIILNT